MENKLTKRQAEALAKFKAAKQVTFRYRPYPHKTTWYADEEPIPYRISKALVRAGLLKYSGRKENGGAVEHWEVSP